MPVFLLLSSLAAALLLVEGGLRLYFHFKTNYDIEMWKYAIELKQEVPDARSHVHRPSRGAHLMDVDVSINSHGLRDREIPYEKTPGTYRILAIGDSVAFGWGVAFDRIFPKVIEKNLREEFPVEVLNLGVGNYNTEQELAAFLAEGVRYQPDAVLLFYHITDAEPTQKNRLNFLGRHSYLYAFLLQRWAQLQPFLSSGTHYVPFYQDLYRGEKWERFKPTLSRFADEARSRGIELIPVILPETRSLQAYPFHEFHAALKGAFAEKGIAVIDTLDAFLGKAPEEVMVAKDDPHPNEAAHQIIAALVTEQMKQKLRSRGIRK